MRLHLVGSIVFGASMFCGHSHPVMPDTGWHGTTTSTTLTDTGPPPDCPQLDDPDLFSVTVDWTDDGGSPSTGSCGDRLEIDICDPLGVTRWDFGMAETGSTVGWFGEDCLNGHRDVLLCHPIGAAHRLEQVPSCATGAVVPGQTTWFDAMKDPALTYYLADQTSCFVFGNHPAYYKSLGCTELI